MAARQAIDFAIQAIGLGFVILGVPKTFPIKRWLARGSRFARSIEDLIRMGWQGKPAVGLAS